MGRREGRAPEDFSQTGSSPTDGAAPSRVGLCHALRQACRSLVARCLAILAGAALALVALVFAIGAAGDAMFDGAFPSMETLLEREDDLQADRFEALASSGLEQCLIVVFDGYGTRLYASSEEAARNIRASDLPVIGDYGESSFYEVFRESVGGELRYRVMLCSFEGDERVVDASCTLDGDLNVLEGDLFVGRGSLTEREFGFITGLYNARMTVSRLDYENEDGEARTLVLAAPLVSEGSYERVTEAAGRLWLLAVPGVLIIVSASAVLLARQMRWAARPLDRAIDAYRATGDEGSVVESAEEAGVPTELVPIYENFVDLMARLDESRRDGRRVVADVSHDLKTPLTVIRGYAQAFCDGCVPPEKEGTYHLAIRDKAIAAAELLDVLSDYARMEHPDFRPHLEPANVGQLASEVAREALPLADQAGCELVVEDRTDGVAVALVDVPLFRRMLLNLVGNAFAHNPPGTVVRVRSAVEGGQAATGETGAAGEKSAEVATSAEGSAEATSANATPRWVVVSVADTGRGFSPEVAGRAFEPFVTRNVARTPGQGAGLGLTIARRAAEVMGGSLSLSPGPNAPWVTELLVRLPLADPKQTLSS